MLSYKIKYTILGVVGLVAYLVYAVVFYYYAGSISLSHGSITYFVYSNLNLIFLGFALYYLFKLNRKNSTNKSSSPSL